MPGTLFVVATPIGNLGDLSPRAARTLSAVAVVAAEDTRRTAILLQRHGIPARTISFHEHNELGRLGGLIERLTAGDDIALVSDAGTPAVSDPGFRLVRAAIDAGIRVEAIPGPSAIMTALVVSGLPPDRFVFEGFAPRRSQARLTWLTGLANEPRTILFYEAPHRLRETLAALRSVLGDRRIAVARELTKLHEEVVRGRVSEVLTALPEVRGEVTVVVEGRVDEPAAGAVPDDEGIHREFGCLTKNLGLSRRAAIAQMARRLGLPSRTVYAAIERARGRSG